MDTLKRVGSLRLSKRGKKQKGRREEGEEAKPKESNGGGLLPAEHQPRFYATLGRKEKSAKAFFTISFKDVVVNTLSGYQPTHLKAIFERHRRVRTSDPVLWEPSLKCTSTGSGVWHPPFIIHVAITVPKISKASSQGELLTLRQKDAFVSIENVDLKGKRKLLAKARLNLSEYFESAAENDVSFRLKLHPESSKIASASVDLTLRKSVQDPTKQSTDNAGPCLYDDETGSLGDERILNPSQKSLASSPCSEIEVEKDDDHEKKDSEPVLLQEQEVEDSVVKMEPSSAKTVVPNLTPPPLPPRQRIMSHESPPPSSHSGRLDMLTSTPMVEPPKDLKIAPLASKERISSPSFLTPSPVKESRSRSRSPKPINWNEDNEDKELKELKEEQGQSIGINLSACASPKVSKPKTEERKQSAEKELIDWAKSTLAQEPKVKVTNLTSSWRNGLGFCCILHQSYPGLIPLADLSAEHGRDNNEMAFDVADLLQVIDTGPVRAMALDKEVTDKAIVSDFLCGLRLLISGEFKRQPLQEESVIEFQKKWYRRAKFFKKEVGHLVKKELEELEAAALAASPNEANLEKPCAPVEEESEEKENHSQQRTRARRLIAMAHESSSYEDQDAALDTAASSSPSLTASVAASVGLLVPSGTIMEELSELAREEEQISGEIEKLEQALRRQDLASDEADSEDFEAHLQRYVSLVNEKNSLLRRQMQLNIAEKERAIEHEKDKLQRQLQKFSDLDESQKTEAMRQEEECLLQRYVEAVNEKNELVHDLDSQEKLIAEDERIRSFVANRDILASQNSRAEGKHNIMNELLDFFKSNQPSLQKK